MIVNNKIEFDTAMATATQTTVIELSGATIDWELNITKPCTILGNNTLVDLTGIPYAVIITDACELSGLTIITDMSGISLINEANISNIHITSKNTGVYSSGDGTNGLLEEVVVNGSEHGFVFHNARNYTLTACSANMCSIGYEFEGTSSVLGDTESDPAGLPGVPVPELSRTDRTHSLILNGCISTKNTFGARYVNSDHISWDTSRVFDNTNIGIWQMPFSYKNSFNGEIYKNTAYGIKNTDREGGLHNFNASQTWWGDITGPSGYGKGTGQKISTNVDIDPWLKDGTDPDTLLYPLTRSWIWNMLGYPIVRVELSEEMVTNCINMAIDKFMYYQTPEPDWAYGTIGPDARELDLALLTANGAPLSITKQQVIEVAYQPYNDLFANISGSGSDFFMTYYMQNGGSGFISDFYMMMGAKDDMELTLGINPTYEFVSHLMPNGIVKDCVRLYPRPSSAVKIGIKFSRVLTQEEVDSYTWIRKYALAWAKEQLGRIRSKFSSLPSPTGETTLDGPTLLAESQTEKDALMLELMGLLEPLSFSIG